MVTKDGEQVAVTAATIAMMASVDIEGMILELTQGVMVFRVRRSCDSWTASERQLE